MARILNGRLPVVNQDPVDSGSFNRAMRVLELGLGSFDPTATPQYTSSNRDELSFAVGDIIWNTTEEVLQVYLGNSWQNISTPSSSGLSATGSVGTVQVVTNGNITVAVA